MTIQEFHEQLNFYIDKYAGAYFAPEEIDDAIHQGQLELFSDLLPFYAVNQDVKDMLSPFRAKYTFAAIDTAAGLVTVPTNQKYQKLLELSVNFTENGATRYKSVKIVNEDELAKKLNSQIDAPTATNPIGEQTALGVFQLYPKVTYVGDVRFLRTPTAPVFGYTTPDRLPVYNSGTSTQLEWREIDHQKILLKVLPKLGINIGDGEVTQYAEIKQKQP